MTSPYSSVLQGFFLWQKARKVMFLHIGVEIVPLHCAIQAVTEAQIYIDKPYAKYEGLFCISELNCENSTLSTALISAQVALTPPDYRSWLLHNFSLLLFFLYPFPSLWSLMVTLFMPWIKQPIHLKLTSLNVFRSFDNLVRLTENQMYSMSF